jgi:ATP-dependent DNA ligase I
VQIKNVDKLLILTLRLPEKSNQFIMSEDDEVIIPCGNCKRRTHKTSECPFHIAEADAQFFSDPIKQEDGEEGAVDEAGFPLEQRSSSDGKSSLLSSPPPLGSLLSEDAANEITFQSIVARLDHLKSLTSSGGPARFARNSSTLVQERMRVIFYGLDKLRANRQSIYPILRLFIPQADNRKKFQLREAKLAELFVHALGLPNMAPDALKLKNFKDSKLTSIGGYASSNTGDFSGILGEVLAPRILNLDGERGKWTIRQVNQWLTDLHTAGGRYGNQRRIHGVETDTTQQHDLFRQLVDECTANQIVWITRIICGDMKISVGQDPILKHYHPDAPEAFASNGDLRSVLTNPTLFDPSHRHKFSISIMVPFAPVSAQKFVANGAPSLVWRLWDKFVIERKLDGERHIIHKQKDEYKFYSRNVKDFTAEHLPALRTALDEALKDIEECILDGELLSYDILTGRWVPFGNNRTTASANTYAMDTLGSLKSETKLLCYMIFDLLWLKGCKSQPHCQGDISERPLIERRKLLRKVVKDVEKRVQVLEYEEVYQGTESERKQLIATALEQAIAGGDEGIVIKQSLSTYKFGTRMTEWIKVKPEYATTGAQTIDGVIVGGYYPEGSGWRNKLKSSSSTPTMIGTKPSDFKPSHFLIALPEDDMAARKGGDGSASSRPIRWKAFCKVGTGYGNDELIRVQSFLQDNWIAVSNEKGESGIPEWLGGGGNGKLPSWIPKDGVNPDYVVRDPLKSLVVEVKGVELYESKHYATSSKGRTYTVRFPRVEAFRFDKSVIDCDRESLVDKIIGKGGKLINGSALQSDALMKPGTRLKKKPVSKKKNQKNTFNQVSVAFGAAPRARGAVLIAKDFDPFDGIADVEADVNIFEGELVWVAAFQDKEWIEAASRLNCPPDLVSSSNKVAQLIARLNGIPVKGYKDTVRFCVSPSMSARTQFAIDNDLDVFTSRWLVDSLENRCLPDPVQPEHILIASKKTNEKLLRTVDEYGDRMTDPIEPKTLAELIRKIIDKEKEVENATCADDSRFNNMNDEEEEGGGGGGGGGGGDESYAIRQSMKLKLTSTERLAQALGLFTEDEREVIMGTKKEDIKAEQRR